jgi:hypothetical protein
MRPSESPEAAGERPDTVAAEIAARRKEASRKQRHHERWQDRYHGWRWWFGALPILLASAAGLIAALDAPPVATALVAFASAVVGGGGKLVQPERRSERHGRLKAEYADLARDAKAAELRLAEVPEGERHELLEQLNDRIHELDVQASRTWTGS